jgi:transposase
MPGLMPARIRSPLIAEAVQRPTVKYVATKTADQPDFQAMHRMREALVSQPSGIINQIRAFCWSVRSKPSRVRTRTTSA